MPHTKIWDTPNKDSGYAKQNYFQSLEIYFHGLKIYFHSLEIYFLSLKITLYAV